MLEIELNELSAEQVKQINILRMMGIPDDIIQLGIDNENKKLKESKASEVVQMNNKYEKIFGRELVEEKHFVFRGLEKIHNKTLCNEEEVFMNSKDISGEINGLISKITVEMNNNIEKAVVGIVRTYNPNNATYEVNAKKIREALEKQIPKKPVKESLSDRLCPICQSYLSFDALNDDVRTDAPNFCEICGQAIDWSGEVEK